MVEDGHGHADSSGPAALDLLAGHNVRTVTVSDLDSMPWAGHVFYVNVGSRLYRLAGTRGRLGPAPTCRQILGRRPRF